MQVLRFHGKPMYYDVLTRLALKLGLIRFTGSQGTAGNLPLLILLSASRPAIHAGLTHRCVCGRAVDDLTGFDWMPMLAGESMKAFLNKTIRERKCPLLVNVGKGKAPAL